MFNLPLKSKILVPTQDHLQNSDEKQCLSFLYCVTNNIILLLLYW